MGNVNKKMILAILLICVVGTSIGFAAFSSSLIIKFHLSVDPSATDFSVIFSKDGVAATQTGAVKGVVTGTNSTDVTDINTATIDNTKLYPTISNLGATLTEPGQSVSYTFYAKNIGKYNAYLTSIVFQNLTNSDFIECIPKSGTSAELVESLCKDISVSITVGSNINTNSTLIGTENHKLAKGANEPITITLSYGGSVLSDGPFKVAIGNIYLTYGSQSTGDVPFLPNQGPSCYISSDKNVDGTPNIGDEVTCGGTEAFLVIPNDTVNHPSSDNTVSLLSKPMIGKNSEEAISFSDTAYWLDAQANLLNKYSNGWVYDENSNLYSYIEDYETKLKSLGVSSAYATVPSLYQVQQIGCSDYSCPMEDSGDIMNFVSNVFWLGNINTNDSEYLYLLDADYSGSIITGLFDEDWSGGGVYKNGLNALVIVDKIDIQPIQN